MARIEYFGEFGYELISVIPYAYWLYTEGKLRSTKSVKDTKCLYYFSPRHKERDRARSFIELELFPASNIHVANLDTLKWTPPPYKKVYKNDRFVWSLPTCVICNKFTLEFDHSQPTNYISLDALQKIIALLISRYQIIYNRPLQYDIVPDHVPVQATEFADHELIREKYPNVISIQQLSQVNKDLSFNTLQVMVYANCNNFISVQGGNAVLASYFGGKNIIYATIGQELRVNSYNNWYSKFSGCKVIHVNTYEGLINKVEEEF